MLPDITKNQQSNLNTPLDWVGMEDVQIPVSINGKTIPARCQLLVNLKDPKAKGIHMSRLYLHAKKILEEQDLSPQVLEKLGQECVDSQEGISDKAMIVVSFELPLKRKALLSDNDGWVYYPMTFAVEGSKDAWVHTVDFALTYSSTCPCSAALARQIRQQQFEKAFKGKEVTLEAVSHWLGEEENQAATPHSQRSTASIYTQFSTVPNISDIFDTINALEAGLKTRVQTAVKREDEQEFARLNAENLMFSEDAARILNDVLKDLPNIETYSVKVMHHESLHPHDAIAVITKQK